MKADILAFLAAAVLAIFFMAPAAAQDVARRQKHFLRRMNSHQGRTYLERGLEELSMPVSRDGADALEASSVDDSSSPEIMLTDGEGEMAIWSSFEVGEDENENFIHLLEPASDTSPACIIFFTPGGVPVLSQFPEVFYKEFLQRLEAKTNCATVAVPFDAGIDHSAIADRMAENMLSALTVLEDERGYSPSLPKYAIGHSTGSRIQVIAIATSDIGEKLTGAAFMGYNNFEMRETISSAMTFNMESEVGGGSEESQSPPPLLNLAARAAAALGLEFNPSPTEVDRMLQSEFSKELLNNTMLFQFETDNLDSTPSFMANFVGHAVGPSLSIVPGTHMTPTFMTSERSTIGDEEALNSLVEEMSNWMLKD